MIIRIRVSDRAGHADAGLLIQLVCDSEVLEEGRQIHITIDRMVNRSNQTALLAARDGHQAFHIHRGILVDKQAATM